MELNKEQFEQCLDELLRSFAAYEHEEGLPSSLDGRHHLNIDHTNYVALLTALRWSLQHIADFEPVYYCVMCGTPVSTIEDHISLCDYHRRLNKSGLVCLWGYADDDGWAFYCCERVFKDGLCERHYSRMQEETPKALYDEAVKALSLMRVEAQFVAPIAG